MAVDRVSGENRIHALVIEDDPQTAAFMQDTVTSRGHECRVCRDGEAGLRAVFDEEPDLIFLDIRLPGISGLQVLEQLRDSKIDAVVVITTAYGSEDIAMRALRLRADDYLRKPVEVADIDAVLAKYAPIIVARRAPREMPPFLVRKECELLIGNDLELVPRVSDFLAFEAGLDKPRDVALGVTLGLAELLTNAIEHGNLGISGPEKTVYLNQGGRAYADLLMRRRAEASRAARRVHVRLISVREYAEWIIADEGDGFNHEDVMRRLNSLDNLSLHGRGIFLASRQFDEMEYNGKGNEVRVRKWRPGSGS